jgi:nitrate/TMAO reductase-like tetraheme cytochrome c subunit
LKISSKNNRMRRTIHFRFSLFAAVVSMAIAMEVFLCAIPASGQVHGICMPLQSPEGKQLNELSDTELKAYLASLGIGSPTYTFELPALQAAPTQYPTGHIPHSVASPSPPLVTTQYTSEDMERLFAFASSQSLLDSSADPGVDPLGSMGPDASKEKERQERRNEVPRDSYLKSKGIDPHAEVFTNTLYPSALQCAKCHQKIYDEWRVSGHAYASVSPMFQRFEQLVQDLTRGTVGTFCMRCHAPVATQMNHPRHFPLLNGPHVFREGITCVVCHRVIERYGRVNGERRIETGSIVDPIVGNSGGDGVAAVLADPEGWKITTDLNDRRPRQAMHQGAIQFQQLSDSSYCAPCHQVVVQPGIGLEIVYMQFRAGPAHAKGITCQNCHMGAVPGKNLGYECGPCAEVNGRTYRNDRKHSNHIFHGPSYPLAHPGLFPHNEKSLRWTADQWLCFDWRAGWGTDAFEKSLALSHARAGFPTAWQNAEDRRDARKIIDDNQRLIAVKRQSALDCLSNGSAIEGPVFAHEPRVGTDLHFHYVIHNTSEGHNMPSGSLGAQPQLWLNAVLIGPDGSRLWESGDLDSNGDLRDLQSEEVAKRRLSPDLQLFNLQTKFLITNVKGTDREMALPVNVDIDPLPFFRPGAVPFTVLNHAPFIRMEAHSIPPVDSKRATYTVSSNLIRSPGRYRLSVRLRSRVEPPYFMRFAKGTPDMIYAMNEGIIDVHPYSVEFDVR